jgi:hypothetical protein
MAKAIGVEIKAAFKKASVWGEAVACGANDGILILPPSLKKDRPNQVDDSLGLYFPEDSDPGEIKVEGDIPAYLRYDSLDLLIALAMGATGGAPVQPDSVNAPNTYQQTFTLADNLDGLFGTFALNNNVNIDEYPSVKVAGFTLKGEVGKPLEITFHCIAIDRITNSSVNTLTSFSNVTYFETSNRVLMSQGVIRMNNQSDAALGIGDEIYPSSFELTFKRNMQGVYGVASGFDKIDEPTNAGQPEVTLKLEFPRYTSDAHFTGWDANTAKKLDMTFTGALIEDTYHRTFRIEFPNLKYANVNLPIEQGILKHPVEFDCLACDTAPSGMTATKPFLIEVINRQSADVLA